jgi:hypothetical protein
MRGGLGNGTKANADTVVITPYTTGTIASTPRMRGRMNNEAMEDLFNC